MKNKMKRVLAFVVAFAMVFTLMPGNSLVSRAEEGDAIDVGENDYTVPEEPKGEENPPKVYDATASSYGTVVIPAGCEFNINIDCTIGSLTIKEGGRVNVFVDWDKNPPKGYDVTINSIVAESGAHIMVGGNSEIKLGEEKFPFMTWDGSESYNGFDWTDFEYIVDEETSKGKWFDVTHVNQYAAIYDDFDVHEENALVKWYVGNDENGKEIWEELPYSNWKSFYNEGYNPEAENPGNEFNPIKLKLAASKLKSLSLLPEDETPVVTVLVNGEVREGANLTSDAESSGDYIWEYTPNSPEPLAIEILWTQAELDFRNFGPTETEFVVLSEAFGNGEVSVTGVAEDARFTFGNQIKVRGTNNNNINYVLTPYEYEDLVSVIVDDDRQEKDTLLTAGSLSYNEENNTYTYALNTASYRAGEEHRVQFEFTCPPSPSFNSYGPIEFNVMELHGRGEVRFKVESDSLGTNSGVLFNVDGNESFSNQDMQQIFENYTLSAGDKITIYAVPKNEGDELVHLGYDLGGEDVFNNDEDARRDAITDASSVSGYTIVLTENKERIHFEMDFQNLNSGEPGASLNEGEIGVEIYKQENGSISIAEIENVNSRIAFEDDFCVLYAYDKSVFENDGKLTVNIVPGENYKVAESLSYANNECFKNIDTNGSSNFRNQDGSYTYNITGSMYDLENQKDTVRIEVEFIEESQEEGGAKPAENEGLKETTETGYAHSTFTVKGKGADGVSVDVMKNGARTTMVYRGENERAFEKYYCAYGELPYATTLDAREGYYQYDEDEKVCLQFSFNFMYRLKSLKINDKDYGVGDNKVTTFGGDEVTFNQLYGDKADRAILLRAFQDQNFGCTVEVDKADAYVIELEVIPVDGYFTERESEDGRRYGNDVVIGNFLWFPTGGHAEDDAMTNGHLEIVSYEVSEADAAALCISEELRKGTINSDSSFGTPGTSFYFHSPNDSTDINTRENGEAVFPVGTKLVCKLVPDYGYQLAEFSVNGAPLTPLNEVSTFKYIVGQGNFHFGATFVPAENKLDCEASENVSAVRIIDDDNAATSGSLALTVTDEATVDEKVTSEYGEAISTIDLTLVNEVKKSETEYWETTISEFENPVTISLTLDPTEFTEDSYKVVRNHITKDSNGDKTNVVEELENVSYDKTTGELSFETNKFSAYTIVKAPCEHTYVAEVNSAITGQLASKATCISKSKYYKYCSKCNELSTETFEAGVVDLTNHAGEKEIRDAKVATCVSDGYTGDTYCKSCNTKLSDGEVIKAAGHKYDAGKITKEPTVDAEGVKTYTCTVCGATKTEAIDKLSKPEPTPDPELPGEEFAEYEGYTFTEDEEGDIRCYDEDGKQIIDEFKCDGEFTYYFQYDGTAMRDRLTYHPDGEHVIYFDDNGHEVFSEFAHITKTISGATVDDYCFFDVYGYMYVDTLTYDKTGTKLYYINEYGLLQHTGWFAFSGHEFEKGLGFQGKPGGFGYANADGSLMTDYHTYDWDGKFVYIQGDGHLFR